MGRGRSGRTQGAFSYGWSSKSDTQGVCSCMAAPAAEGHRERAAGFPSNSFTCFKCIHENSTKQNATAFCKLEIDTLLIEGRVVNSCWIKM